MARQDQTTHEKIEKRAKQLSKDAPHYRFGAVRPILLSFGVAAILMFLESVALGIAGFMWFLFLGGIVLIVGSFFLDRLVALVVKPVPVDEEVLLQHERRAREPRTSPTH